MQRDSKPDPIEIEKLEIKEKLKRLEVKKWQELQKFSDKLSWLAITIGTLIMIGAVILTRR